MNRAMLNPEEVTRIIVSSTMTMPSEDALNDLVIEKCCHTPEKLGCHYVLLRNGDVLTPVSDDERGNWFSRYGETSIVIVIEGGMNDEGQISSNYYVGQLNALRSITKNLKKKYTTAVVTPHHELFLGVNPVIDKEFFNEENS